MRLASIFLLPLFSALLPAQNPVVTVTVDAALNRHTIHPNIYGIAYGDAHDMATLNAPLNRWGGNATTRYNWQIDAHSAAADWYFETYPMATELQPHRRTPMWRQHAQPTTGPSPCSPFR
jgi:hypothetical protein